MHLPRESSKGTGQSKAKTILNMLYVAYSDTNILFWLVLVKPPCHQRVTTPSRTVQHCRG